MAVKPIDGDVLLDRFLELRRWLREVVGVCFYCCDTLAFLQCDREGGGPKDVKPNLADCAHRDGGAKCRDRANAAKRTMPGRR
jgi:hypothetical protein